MPYNYTRQQRWEIITSAISCLTAGFLYITLSLILPLPYLFNWVVRVLGILLLLLGPILLTLTYKHSYKPKALKLLRILRLPLLGASFLSIVYAVARIGELFKNMNLVWISVIFICYMILSFILLIIAEMFAGRGR